MAQDTPAAEEAKPSYEETQFFPFRLFYSSIGYSLVVDSPAFFSLQERWLLLPQAPPSESSTPIITEKTFSRGGDSGQILVGRALMIRLAMKEDVLEEGSTSTLDNMEVAECSVERAAACAR